MNTRLVLTFSILLGGTIPLSAAAQPATPAQPTDAKAQALAAADKGKQHFNEGKYAEAITAFQEADKRVHAPTFVLMIARSQDKLGRLLQARATYQRMVDERLAEGAPPPFLEAQANAKDELAALNTRIPTLQITVTGPSADAVVITVDDVVVQMGQPVTLDPGEHTVTARAPGYTPATQKVTLQEKAAEQLPLELQVEGPATAASTAIQPVSDTTTGRRLLVPAIISFGVAGIGVGLGVVTGAMSSGKVSDLKERCPEGKCYNNVEDMYSSAQTLATVSTIGFVVGGLAAAGGVVLLALDSGGKQPTRTGLAVGPAWVGVRGGF